MTIDKWEKHTLKAQQALQDNDYLRSVLHYQQALSISHDLLEETSIDIADKLTINIISCHNLANFWRAHGDEEYELKYLQLASERFLTIVPQCPNAQCDAFIDSLGCCKKALISFLQRHPNPVVAKQVQQLETITQCEMIAKFKLH